MSEDRDISLVRGANGLTYVRFGDLQIGLVIPSRRRSRVIVRHPLLRWANVFVHASEFDEYQRALNGLAPALLTHDHQYYGPILVTMIDRAFAEERCDFVVKTDDDFVGFQYLWTMRPHKITDSRTILEILCHVGLVAKEMKAGVFGFNLSARPVARQAMEPFRLYTWVKGGVMGYVQRDLRNDPRINMHEDVDLCLQAISKYGYLLCDQRWTVITDTRGRNTDTGGLAGYRNTETYMAESQLMAKKWPGVFEVLDKFDQAGMVRTAVHTSKLFGKS